MKRKLSRRTAERLIRAAYDFEDLAGRLREDGHERFADYVKSISRDLGDCGRKMEQEIGGTN